MGKYLIFLFIFLCNFIFAKIVEVPVDGSPTLKEAVDSANSGDTIILLPGVHKITEPIVIKKSITLASKYYTTKKEHYINETVIDGSNYLSSQSSHKNGDMITIAKESNFVRISGLSFQNTNYFLVIYSKVHIDHCNTIGDNNLHDVISFEHSGYGYVGYCKLHSKSSSGGDDAIDIDSNYGDITIEYNTIYNCGDDGIESRFYKASKPITYIFRNNKFIGNKEDGIQFIDYEGDKRTIYVHNNLFQDNRKAGLGCMPDGDTVEKYTGAKLQESVYVYNNTFDDNNYAMTGSSNMIALNNIFTNNKYAVVHLKSNSILDYSLFYGNQHNSVDVSKGDNIYYLNPKYNSDYTLSGSSPCIDSGVASYTFNGKKVLDLKDYNSKAPDIGAYEFLDESTQGEPINQPPVVDAGDNQKVIAPNNSIKLNAKVKDDSKDFIVKWTKESGAGEVDFSDSSTLNPTVIFSKQGLYVLKLSVDDGEYVRSSTVDIEYVEDAKDNTIKVDNSPLYIEAEDSYYTLVSPMDKTNEALITKASDGYAKYYLTMNERSSDYYIWFKVATIDSNRHYFSVQFRDNSIVRVDVPASSEYKWIKVPTTISTTAGNWKFMVFANDKGVLIDKFCITTNREFSPIENEDNESEEVLTPDNQTKVVDIAISNGMDDVEEAISDGSMYVNSSDLELAIDNGIKQYVGLRFNNINIPKEAIVTKAYIQFSVDETRNIDGELSIWGEYSANSLAFSTKSYDVSSRMKTDSVINWTPSRWNSIGEHGDSQKTVELNSIVQEIIDIDGWSIGNSMSFIITGSAMRVADSFEGKHAPILHIEYIEKAVDSSHIDRELDIVDSQVSLGSDDAEESVESGAVSLNSSDLELAKDKDLQYIGIRFTNLNLPPNAKIKKSYIQFSVASATKESCELTIGAERSIKAKTFNYDSYDISSRPTVDTTISWSPDKWLYRHDKTLAQRTPDLSAVIQNVVDLSNGEKIDSIAIIINGSGVRNAVSYNGKSELAPILHIEYIKE